MKADKETVRYIVSMESVLGLYNLRPQRHNKYKCPFHSEKTPSASVKNNYFHCFGCGVHYDIFGFAMHMNSCTFVEALDWLCDAFNIPNDGKPDHELEKRLLARQEEGEARKRKQEYQGYVWRRLCDYLHWLREQKQTELIINHIAWCERLLDRMIDGEFNYDGFSIDDHLRGMWQQHKA